MRDFMAQSRNNYWFVGASWGTDGDQTPRFLAQGIWENGYQDKYADLVNAMQPGDCIAIKAAYTRKNHLPFYYQGRKAAVMSIKAVGTIVSNLNDGRRINVQWTKVDPVREWYFYTGRNTVWCVQSGEWKADALIAFAFNNQAQNIDRFHAEYYPKIADNSVEDNTAETETIVQDRLLEAESYATTNIVNEGCFLELAEVDRLLERLKSKKNLILQGPPGTGKTWLAKRLAYALIGQKDTTKLFAVQFHPNLSYEDFVRGFRPNGQGGLALVDGIFMLAINAALQNPAATFVFVIEEINRGNPAQIFGELLTLLEADKRHPDAGLQLCYTDTDKPHLPVYIPDNLFVIGTMNIADRSLALVDLALRRRFAFVTLEPKFTNTWQQWLIHHCGLDAELVAEIKARLLALNQQIAADTQLGKPFQIGHSYVTPTEGLTVSNTKAWFQEIVETEIGPLLEEYWFDAPTTAQDAITRLLKDW
jgi:5-methylcytosine-specific restriction protein B